MCCITSTNTCTQRGDREQELQESIAQRELKNYVDSVFSIDEYYIMPGVSIEKIDNATERMDVDVSCETQRSRRSLQEYLEERLDQYTKTHVLSVRMPQTARLFFAQLLFCSPSYCEQAYLSAPRVFYSIGVVKTTTLFADLRFINNAAVSTPGPLKEKQFLAVREHLETHFNTLSDHRVLIDVNAKNIQELEASHSAIEVRVTALLDDVKSLDVLTSSAISNSTPEILERVKRSHNILIKGIGASEDRLNDYMILKRCVNHITPTSSYCNLFY
ncbi:hypothetical protein HHI36_007148 [Cryptolaemus montrouzieri]|uniref:Uncharacterized protein n=1 Tax=Cryptolaemus montrouzieri TaxID=559131 RepID=A0ABD2MNN6_9CUCU